MTQGENSTGRCTAGAGLVADQQRLGRACELGATARPLDAPAAPAG